MKEPTFRGYGLFELPAKDRKTALATGKRKYLGECKRGHGVRRTATGQCIGCMRLHNEKRYLSRHPERNPSNTMLKIERLKDEMELKKLIGEDDEW